MIKRLLSLATHKIYSLPILVLMPHSSCNCRCVMCDIWKSNQNKKEISAESLEKHVTTFSKLGVREVVLSGGEALLHSNLWKLCALLKEHKIRITLLSTGLLLKKHAEAICKHIDRVIVSLDGSEQVHDQIRNIPQGFAKMAEGIRELRKRKADLPITGRCVLQRSNYRDLPNIISSARILGLDQISFLAADVSTPAFNRPEAWNMDKVIQVALDEQDTKEFRKVVEESIREFGNLYKRKFIAESPRKMFDLVRYYEALLGEGEFPIKQCNAPWVSAVVEADGEVRPCFFHKSYGSIYRQEFMEIVNSPEAVSFRSELDVKRDSVCKKCVCSLKLGLAE